MRRQPTRSEVCAAPWQDHPVYTGAVMEGNRISGAKALPCYGGQNR